jgi:hypothetical protein
VIVAVVVVVVVRSIAHRICKKRKHNKAEEEKGARELQMAEKRTKTNWACGM